MRFEVMRSLRFEVMRGKVFRVFKVFKVEIMWSIPPRMVLKTLQPHNLTTLIKTPTRPLKQTGERRQLVTPTVRWAQYILLRASP